MLCIAEESCNCRGCHKMIKAGARISWVESKGPYHLFCTPQEDDKECAAQEILGAERFVAELRGRQKKSAFRENLKQLSGRLVDLLCFVGGPMMIVLSVGGSRIRYGTESGSGDTVYVAIGVGLLAVGLLRKYWSVRER